MLIDGDENYNFFENTLKSDVQIANSNYLMFKMIKRK